MRDGGGRAVGASGNCVRTGTRVLLISSRTLILRKVQHVLRSIPSIEITSTIASKTGTTRLVKRQSCSVCILSIGLPSVSKFSLISVVHRVGRDTHVVVDAVRRRV